ncbi:MAG TPA: DUF58 domain-containing protein [Candidatus Acidoferrales bacterium]|nr:DUF58 domain-containing protein [Candidatus Acidoferrales bacterium]
MTSAANAFENPKKERSAWRNFFYGMIALAQALFLAIYSGAAAQSGSLATAAIAGLGALALAGWTAVTVVPALARRTALNWLAYQIEYRITKQGVVFIGGVFAVALAALNTGNNLLFLILGCMLAAILISGVLSRITVTALELDFALPEHIFARRPANALIELRNHKSLMPSFSLRVATPTSKPARNKANPSKVSRPAQVGAILSTPVFFPFIPRRDSLRQSVDLTFPRRGRYQQKVLSVSTRFPFGFLEKTRRVSMEREVIVYPPIAPTDQFFEILPLLSGELESFQRGRGHDLYAIRDLLPNDNARFVDWKATARTGGLMVREFAREDERRVLLALDPFVASVKGDEAQFEKAVNLCAALAWHFFELDAVVGFNSAGIEVPLARSSESIYDIMRHLALAEPIGEDSGEDELAPQAVTRSQLLRHLSEHDDVYKIVLTSAPRGSIPTALWSSSYMLYFNQL